MLIGIKMTISGERTLSDFTYFEPCTDKVRPDAIRPMTMKVCVVSGAAETHAAVRETLAPMGIWDVVSFKSFQEARARAGARAYDLIVLDCPPISTLAANFIAERRADEDIAVAATPILVTVDKIDRSALTFFQECGADSVLLRPLDAGALSDRVQRLLMLDSSIAADTRAAA